MLSRSGDVNRRIEGQSDDEDFPAADRGPCTGCALALAACTATYRNHGYIPEEDLAQIVVGKTTQGELEGLIGKPSAQGLLAGSGWYYVGSRWKFMGLANRARSSARWSPSASTRPAPSPMSSGSGLIAADRGAVAPCHLIPAVSSLGLIRQLMGSVGRVNAGDLLTDS